MSDDNSKEILMSFAMKELTRIIEDLKSGKTPEMSPEMKKLQDKISSFKSKEAKEEKVEEFAKDLLKDIKGVSNE